MLIPNLAQTLAEGWNMLLEETQPDPARPQLRHSYRFISAQRTVLFGVQRNTWSGGRLVRSLRHFRFPPNLQPLVGLGASYRLVGVISHVGSAIRGHYTAYCRRGERWFHFNDELKTEVGIGTVLQQTASVYLLAYSRD